VDWTVWGSGTKPLLEGTEEDVKQYILDNPRKSDDMGLYIMSPDGREIEYDSINESWRECQ
jgi:hypothetical protein